MDVNGKNQSARGMTLLETVMAAMIFSVLAAALYASTFAMQRFTTIAITDIDLQEAARNALQKMMSDLKQAGRCTVGGLAFPRFGNYCIPTPSGVASAYTLPSGYGGPNGSGGNVFDHTPPVVVYNNASFTAPSREILLVQPNVSLANPAYIPYSYNSTTGMATVDWGTQQIAYIVRYDAASGLNRLERWVYDSSQGKITDQTVLAAGVQRLVVDDCGMTDQYYNSPTNITSPYVYTGPTLKQDQLVITLYCAGQPDFNASQVVNTILSVTVNMRNMPDS